MLSRTINVEWEFASDGLSLSASQWYSAQWGAWKGVFASCSRFEQLLWMKNNIRTDAADFIGTEPDLQRFARAHPAWTGSYIKVALYIRVKVKRKLIRSCRLLFYRIIRAFLMKLPFILHEYEYTPNDTIVLLDTPLEIALIVFICE